jgi:hypothetical protein
MWERRDIVRAGAAIIVTMAGWGLIRLLFPSLDYFPPENLVRDLDRSWVVAAGIRKLVMTVYGLVAVVLMAVFFKGVQERWPGRGAAKGLVFGASIGGVWAFGFLTGWAFLGTTLRQEFKNIAVDSIPLAIAGLMIGLAVGREVPKSWAGGMYVILRAWLPFETTWARVAFFAFGVFGHCWTWFHLFIPVIEFAGILHVGLLVGLVGAIGVFAGALSYEWLTRGNPSGVTPAINR